MSSFFSKNFGACYLICKNQRLITYRLCNEGLLFSFLVHDIWCMVQFFLSKKLKKLPKKLQNTIKFVVI